MIIPIFLIFSSLLSANSNTELRSGSELEAEAVLMTGLEETRALIESNPELSELERDLALAQINAVIEKIDEHVVEVVQHKRNIEKANGEYALVAIGIGFGGEATPLKVNFPKWIPALGVGGEASGGLLAAFTSGKERIKFSGFASRGFHTSIMPKQGRAFSLRNRAQTFFTIKLFFSASILNPVSNRYELINFSDLNRNFYGGGKDSGWNIKLPKTSYLISKESTSYQVYGAWVDENSELSPENEVAIDDSWWSRVGTYSLNMVESKSPEILMVSINIGVHKNDDIGNSYQIEMQKVSTFLDNHGSGKGFLEFLGDLF